MLSLDRSRRAGPWLEWKVRLFVVAAVLALGGMYLQQRWMTGAAIAVLVVAMALRFLPGGRVAKRDEGESGDEEGEEEDQDEPQGV